LLSGALGAGNGEGYSCGFAIDYGSVTSDFFWWRANFLHFVKNILQTDSLSQVPWSIEYFWSKYNFLQIPQNCLNCLQYKRVLKISYFHIFEYHQIWLKEILKICGASWA
jgi:hypothetical protein